MKFLIILHCFISFLLASNYIEPFNANFNQTVTNINNKTLTYNGQIFTSSKNQILWKYKNPTIKNIYINKTEVIVEEPELEQAIITNINNSLNLNTIIKNANQISNTKYETIINNTKYTLIIENKKINTISYKDELENKISINFSDIKLNPNNKNEIFIFLPKEDYDIIYK